VITKEDVKLALVALDEALMRPTGSTFASRRALILLRFEKLDQLVREWLDTH
jgi:hypothetical protein